MREVEVNLHPGKVTLIHCQFCGESYRFNGLDSSVVYNRTKNIQDILPNLAPEYREMFISGMCPKCWKDTFGDEE